jgi:hypothetical protein
VLAAAAAAAVLSRLADASNVHDFVPTAPLLPAFYCSFASWSIVIVCLLAYLLLSAMQCSAWPASDTGGLSESVLMQLTLCAALMMRTNRPAVSVVIVQFNFYHLQILQLPCACPQFSAGWCFVEEIAWRLSQLHMAVHGQLIDLGRR